MDHTPSVSVIIPVYNRTRYLGAAIESVLAQSCRDFEIIVVDDGSSSDIKAAIVAYADRVRYIRHPKNKGLSAARNTGIRNANGEYLAFLDDDDLFEPNKLAFQSALLRNNPSAGFVYSGYYSFLTTAPSERGLILPNERAFSPQEFLKAYYLHHDLVVSSFLIRSSCVGLTGLFDEKWEVNEDVDYWLRLGAKCAPIYSDYPSTMIRQHSERMSVDRPVILRSLINCLSSHLADNGALRQSLGPDGPRKLRELRRSLAWECAKQGEAKAAQNVFWELAGSGSSLTALYFKGLALSALYMPSVLSGTRKVVKKLFSKMRRSKVLMSRLSPLKTGQLGFIGGTTRRRDVCLIISSLLKRKNYLYGNVIGEYEKLFAACTGAEHAVSFGAGRMAFFAILKALDVKEGDEVIVPGYTCVVVPNAVKACGAIPVYADIEISTLNACADSIAKKITPRTKAICVAHTFASFADMRQILAVAEKHGLKVIEDCAHSLGARYGGKYPGTFGDAAFFTTEQSKLISTGKGGMAVTNDKALADKLKHLQAEAATPSLSETKRIMLQALFSHIFSSIKWYAGKALAQKLWQRTGFAILSTTKDEIEGNSHVPFVFEKLSNIQAVLGRSQLNALRENLSHRRMLGEEYIRIFRKYGYYIPAKTDALYEPIYIRFWLLINNRELFSQLLSETSFETGKWFASPVHPQDTTLRNINYQWGSCPVSEYAASCNINFPVNYNVDKKDLSRLERFMDSLPVQTHELFRIPAPQKTVSSQDPDGAAIKT